AWGEEPEAFFGETFLQQSGDFGLSSSLVVGVFVPLLLVWLFTLLVLRGGIQKGIARLAQVFIPVLSVIFIMSGIQALRRRGALDGLNALFSPDWSGPTDSQVWVSAYGQIFFSLSFAFGLMITYAAHLKRKTNLTRSGLVLACSNS